ncbi:MAG: hypothetical protein K0R25_563 [Rickettsiaceae bacterium]|jgi:tRNA threonylcarbamoyl adenosine modification protein YjeE|nr:hypothetical protein [Rickettsiaceae bacterium]
MHHLKNKIAMENLAIALASQSEIGDVFGLVGTLGAGKSFFASCFINFLMDKKTEILSPTFNLLYSYQTKKGPAHHLDLYRLKNEEELENIGLFDCQKDGICLIEWPDLAKKFLDKKNYTEIKIEIGQGEERMINISGKYQF